MTAVNTPRPMEPIRTKHEISCTKYRYRDPIDLDNMVIQDLAPYPFLHPSATLYHKLKALAEHHSHSPPRSNIGNTFTD
jgi:hypothetical protein